MCMNGVQYSVSQYDTELPIALSTLNLRLQSTKKPKSNANESLGLVTYGGVDDTLSIPTGIYNPYYRYDKDFDGLLLATVAVSTHKVSTPVESCDPNTVVKTDVDGIHYSSNVIDYANICDTVRKFFPWLGWFEGKLSSVDKKKSGKVFTIKYEYNTSEHWSIEEFAYYSS